MRSTTSSSPHGPSFIDYIAGSQDKLISHFDTIMASLPFRTGYAPLAWSKATDVMIPKKADTISVEQLRIIVLYHNNNRKSNFIDEKLARPVGRGRTNIASEAP